MSDITDRIAAIIAFHRFDGDMYECWCQLDMSDADVMCMDRVEHSTHVAEVIADQLGLTKETRINAMSSSGITTEYRTGETTFHSDIRYDRRYVTPWESNA